MPESLIHSSAASAKVGYYCWAGPGLERMTQLKFFNPKIDRDSLYTAYDYDHLARVQETFGITDCWVTFSWGFSDETEAPDREFIVSRLENFKKLGLKVHAYLQGPNLVFKEFKDHPDWFCRDHRGRFIPYHRGRKVVNINHPEYLEFAKERIKIACQHDFDGIFIDNIQMGQMGYPLPFAVHIGFVGCASPLTSQLFKDSTGFDLPSRLERNREVSAAYLQFRTDSVTQYVSTLAAVAHHHGKLFGTNSFDPKFDTKYVFGTDLEALAQVQDYLLFENHAHPVTSHGNKYISQLRSTLDTNKDIFVVSYQKGIGFDNQWPLEHFKQLIVEARTENAFTPVLKGSEFFSNGVWHNLQLDKMLVSKNIQYRLKKSARKKSRKLNFLWLQLFKLPMIGRILRRLSRHLFIGYFENKFLRVLMNPLYALAR